ncbi:L,D-transpeptidase family protein [Mesobacterium pallidum]|uniref:L,D-transpeptidase family protein n=1 Tax=Mesobacterium pallidum TaxID=2872037 RepID=UPI001EE31253|nr:L,D-transpeptidase family protein [Mesobacterium pallidum]
MAPQGLCLTPTGLTFLGRRFPCVIGRTGLTDNKREGDMATPLGTWRISALLYRPDRLPRPAPWAQAIRPRDLWSDDSARPDYNQPVTAPYAGSHEALRRADPLYDLVLVTDWNAAGTPGKGSAIFLHQWRRPGFPTAGCIAFRRDHLHWIAARAAPGTRVIVRGMVG